eukprot:gb/GECH01012249.1/.p1 GENE.gb/GECH01012249.1/~~gb/GECH01012249.1/.p1  ORF type:complete len:317 (+),score=73.26 gb/GECH01012249.1/:1-951(+)
MSISFNTKLLYLTIIFSALFFSTLPIISQAFEEEAFKTTILANLQHDDNFKKCTLQHVNAYTGRILKNISTESYLCRDASHANQKGPPIVHYSNQKNIMYVLPESGVKFIHRINAKNGKTMSPIQLPTKDIILGMDYSELREEIYLVTNDKVYTIDESSGNSQVTAQIQFESIYSTALNDQDSILFLAEGKHDGNGTLTGVDLSSGKVSKVTLPAQLNLCLMLQYSPTKDNPRGKLYWLDRLKYYQVDLSNHHVEKVLDVPNSDGYPSKAAFDPHTQKIVVTSLFNMFLLDMKNGKVDASSNFDGYRSFGFSFINQ